MNALCVLLVFYTTATCFFKYIIENTIMTKICLSFTGLALVTIAIYVYLVNKGKELRVR